MVLAPENTIIHTYHARTLTSKSRFAWDEDQVSVIEDFIRHDPNFHKEVKKVNPTSNITKAVLKKVDLRPLYDALGYPDFTDWTNIDNDKITDIISEKVQRKVVDVYTNLKIQSPSSSLTGFKQSRKSGASLQSSRPSSSRSMRSSQSIAEEKLDFPLNSPQQSSTPNTRSVQSNFTPRGELVPALQQHYVSQRGPFQQSTSGSETFTPATQRSSSYLSTINSPSGGSAATSPGPQFGSSSMAPQQQFGSDPHHSVHCNTHQQTIAATSATTAPAVLEAASMMPGRINSMTPGSNRHQTSTPAQPTRETSRPRDPPTNFQAPFLAEQDEPLPLPGNYPDEDQTLSPRQMPSRPPASSNPAQFLVVDVPLADRTRLVERRRKAATRQQQLLEEDARKIATQRAREEAEIIRLEVNFQREEIARLEAEEAEVREMEAANARRAQAIQYGTRVVDNLRVRRSSMVGLPDAEVLSESDNAGSDDYGQHEAQPERRASTSTRDGLRYQESPPVANMRHAPRTPGRPSLSQDYRSQGQENWDTPREARYESEDSDTPVPPPAPEQSRTRRSRSQRQHSHSSVGASPQQDSYPWPSFPQTALPRAAENTGQSPRQQVQLADDMISETDMAMEQLLEEMASRDNMGRPRRG